MNPFDIPVFTKERLKKYRGFEEMTDEELDLALSVMYTITDVYLNSKSKIDEYERIKLRQVQRFCETEGTGTTGEEAA